MTRRTIDELRRAGDSIGARINLIASGVPVGLGEPVFDKLEGEIAKGLMSINAVKGVEFGDGFECVRQRGSELSTRTVWTCGWSRWSIYLGPL